MSFKEISDESFKRAFEILHGENLSSNDKKLNSAAQNAIEAMVEATPRLGRYENKINRYDFMVPGRPHHNALHTSIARMIEQQPDDDIARNAHKLAADTIIQVDGRHICGAIKLDFVGSLGEQCRQIAQAAERRHVIHEELQIRSVGDYHLLSQQSQIEIQENIENPRAFIPEVVQAIDRNITSYHQAMNQHLAGNAYAR